MPTAAYRPDVYQIAPRRQRPRLARTPDVSGPPWVGAEVLTKPFLAVGVSVPGRTMRTTKGAASC